MTQDNNLLFSLIFLSVNWIQQNISDLLRCGHSQSGWVAVIWRLPWLSLQSFQSPRLWEGAALIATNPELHIPFVVVGTGTRKHYVSSIPWLAGFPLESAIERHSRKTGRQDKKRGSSCLCFQLRCSRSRHLVPIPATSAFYFCWGIIDTYIILISGVQCNNSMFIYVAKWSWE